MRRTRVPVVALTGHLGAGKTTVLNHLLRLPGARLGVIVNDFGAINVDAGLVTGQVDAAASIAGGCVCCLPDGGGLDESLATLAQPRLRLDAIVVEASGIAEPLALAGLIHRSRAAGVRPGGLVDVVDAPAYFATVDTRVEPPARFAAATLVVINKVDLVPAAQRREVVACIRERIRLRNPAAEIVETRHGRLDPALVLDAASAHEAPDELPIAALLRAADGAAPDEAARDGARGHGHDHEGHHHARAVSVPAAAPIDAGRLVDLLEQPPAGVYRLKGTVRVDSGRSRRCYVVHLVGRHIHVAPHAGAAEGLVAIGTDVEPDEVESRLRHVLEPLDGVAAEGVRRLQRYRRLSGA